MSDAQVRNPYWDELIAAGPEAQNGIMARFKRYNGPSFDGLIGEGGRPPRLSRNELTNRYAWAIPAPDAVAWLAEQLAGRPVVEVFAGTGYWAWQLTQHGVDVAAYDAAPPDQDTANHWHQGVTCFHPVQRADAVAAAAEHPDRALFLCWPPYGDPAAAGALQAYRGDMVVYVGEWGGATADDDFHAQLEEGWDLAAEYGAHAVWDGMWDRLTIHHRRNP